MGNLFKFLLALTMLLTGSMHKGLAISERKSVISVSLSAFAQQKTPHYHFSGKDVPVFKRGHFHAENIFYADQAALDEEESKHYQKLLASLPSALPPSPGNIDLHLVPGAFHGPRKLLALHNRDARAYAGKPVYVLFGVFLL